MKYTGTLSNLILYSILSESTAFVPSSQYTKAQIGSANGKGRFRSAALYASSDEKKSRSSDRNESRTCVRNFLTQRSIQSFMFVLKEMHDPHTNRWIEDLLGAQNLLSYHGSGAIDLEQFPVWDSIFTEMVSREPDVVHVEIKSKQKGRHGRDKPFDAYETPSSGAWAGKDYLKNMGQKTKETSFTTELSGPGLKSYADAMGGGTAKKSPSTPRGTFAGKDYLSHLTPAQSVSNKPERKTPRVTSFGNDYLSQLSAVKPTSEEPKKKGKKKAITSKAKPVPIEEEKIVTVDIDIDPPSLANRLLTVRAKIGQEWASDLELMLSVNEKIIPSYNARKKEARENEDRNEKKDASDFNAEADRDIKSIEPGAMSSGDFNFGCRSVRTFERGAIYLVNNHPSFNDPESTPLRSSSFDLLFLLSTQEAIHRLLVSYEDEGEEKAVSRAWLKKFYVDNLETYFDGCQTFGRADDFIDDLLVTPPALKTIGDKIGFIDPLAIAEDIIDFRAIVANEWREAMSNVVEDHEPIQNDIFVRQISKWGGFNLMGTSSNSKETDATEASNCAGGMIDGGDFQ